MDFMEIESPAMRVDIHQHIWTESLIEALAARTQLPFVRRDDGLTVLHAAGERPWVIDLEAEAPAARAALLRGDRIDLALIAISSPIGIEALDRDSASTMIEAHLRGVAALGEGFAPWGPVALRDPDPGDVDRLRADGCVGVSLPAGALAGPEALDAISPLLERAAELRMPVFIHPGRAPGRGVPEASMNEPLWWRALTDYVVQMQAAWLTFATEGRRQHPELVAVFAMLAGGAPLLCERLDARGGPGVDLRDPGVYYDTSSYGPVAIEAMARRVGTEQLLYGSDRPVVEPIANGREAILQANAAAALFGTKRLRAAGVAA
jgi:6-methylsalicylate decarboxylase